MGGGCEDRMDAPITSSPFTTTAGPGALAYASYAASRTLPTTQPASLIPPTTTPSNPKPNTLKPWQTFADQLNTAQPSATQLTGRDALNTAPSPASPATTDLNHAPVHSQLTTSSLLESLNTQSLISTQPAAKTYTDKGRLIDSVSAPAAVFPSTPSTAPAVPPAALITPTLHVLTDAEKKVRKVAGDLVANALILPLLKQNRRSVWSENKIFKRGAGENAFGPEFDTQLADRVAHSPHMSVTDALTRQLMAKRTNDAAVTFANQNSGVDLHG